MKFINKEHEERFNYLIGRGISETDIERVPGMFIMSGNKELFDKANELFDFEKSRYRVEYKEGEDGIRKIHFERPLSSSEKRLMILAFDMYSGSNNIGVDELFSCLDRRNRELALRAIAMRY